MSDDGDEHVHPGKGKSPAYSLLNKKGLSVFDRSESENLTDEMHSLGQQMSCMRDCIASMFDEQAGLRSKTHAAVQLATTCENTVGHPVTLPARVAIDASARNNGEPISCAPIRKSVNRE